MENLIINRRKQRKTNMKGITLIALVITIIVLLILAGVSIAMLTGNSGILTQANEGKEKSEIAEVKERVQTDIAAKQAENKNPILIERELNEILSKYGIVEDRNGKKVLVTKDGKYEILVEDIWAGILSKDYIVADGSWDGQVNTPKLTSDMSPVAWDDSNNEYIPKTNDEWFNYEEQRWANAKTKDGSYWVWIPRFEYKIIDTTGGDYTKAGEIKIRFISADTKKGTSGYTTIDGITKSDDEYIIHPVFTDGRDEGFSNGEWDSELSGFWISKYKMSQVDGTGNNIATVSSEKGNVGLSDNVKMVSKPGMSMWSNINVANCYTNSFKYDRNKESHLTKNSEWGALVYLTHSKFGRNGQEVTLNTTSYAGGGENEEYKSQVVQNSTNNITGVYDISGGYFHKMAVFNNSYSGSMFENKDVEGNHFASTGGQSTKYATAYSNNTDVVNGDFSVGEVSKIGDAVGEICTKGQYSWFNDYAHYVFMGNAFLHRGGVGSWGATDGIFSSVSNNGSGTGNDSFRVALCI